MMRCLPILGFLVLACVPTMESIEAARQARTAKAQATTNQELEELGRTCEAGWQSFRTVWKREAVYPVCDSQVPPGSMCGLLIDKYSLDQTSPCRGLATETECWRTYESELRGRYGEIPPLSSICPSGCSLQQYEYEILVQHDVRVKEEHDRQVDALVKRCDELKAAAKARLEVEKSNITADAIAQVKDAEIQAERHREAWRAVGVGLYQLGNALRNSTKNTSQGCCSYHGGICGCSAGTVICCDDTLSPSCGC